MISEIESIAALISNEISSLPPPSSICILAFTRYSQDFNKQSRCLSLVIITSLWLFFVTSSLAFFIISASSLSIFSPVFAETVNAFFESPGLKSILLMILITAALLLDSVKPPNTSLILVTSSTSRTISASSILTFDRLTPSFSIISCVSLIPAVSTRLKRIPPIIRGSSR